MEKGWLKEIKSQDKAKKKNKKLNYDSKNIHLKMSKVEIF